MTKLKVLLPLVLPTLGCNLILDGANDGMIGDDEAGDEIEEGNLTQNLWCDTLGACVVSVPKISIEVLSTEVKYHAFEWMFNVLNKEGELFPWEGTCESPIVTYPCEIILDPVVEIDPLSGNDVDMSAFTFTCSVCPENTPQFNWYTGPELSTNQFPFCMNRSAYNHINIAEEYTLKSDIGTYLTILNPNFQLGCSPDMGPEDPDQNPYPDPEISTSKIAPRGFVTYQLSDGPIGLCESDIDCSYLTDDVPPFEGEGVCEGWPFFRTVDPVSGVQVDIPRGCFRVTDENGGVVPPIPSVGGLMVEDNLFCGDLTCEVTMPFVEAVIDDAITASVGMFWRISDDAIYLTDVKSYSLGSLMGLKTGDVLRGSVEELGSKYAHLVEHGTAEITILRGRETKTLILNIVE